MPGGCLTCRRYRCVEDFSEVKSLLDDVRERHYRLPHFVDVHPQFVRSCMGRIRVVDVNRQTLNLFGASSKGRSCWRGCRRSFAMKWAFVRRATARLLAWQSVPVAETQLLAAPGDAINLHMQWAVLPGHEADWDLVQVALTDITARKKAESLPDFSAATMRWTKLHPGVTTMKSPAQPPWTVPGGCWPSLERPQACQRRVWSAGDALLRRAGRSAEDPGRYRAGPG